MVEYTCGICKTNYESLKEAESCESKGVVGPDFKPGLLFSHKDVERSFLVFYNQLNSEGHDKKYHVETILQWSECHVGGLQDIAMTASKLEEWLSLYEVANDKEVEELNDKLWDKKVLGLRGIEVYMKRFGIEKLHNETPEEIFSQ